MNFKLEDNLVYLSKKYLTKKEVSREFMLFF